MYRRFVLRRFVEERRRLVCAPKEMLILVQIFNFLLRKYFQWVKHKDLRYCLTILNT
jgi:hypothetical protein